jgi:hypothetical protein
MAGGSDSGSSSPSSYRNREDGIPSPHLRLLEHKIEEDLEVRRVLEIKREPVQRISGAFEMLCSFGWCEIHKGSGAGQHQSEGEDWRSSRRRGAAAAAAAAACKV